MKRNFILSLSLFLLTFVMKSQVSLTTATDFTVTDLDGNSHNLYSILNSGKYVCLDFFFTTCGPCQQTIPHFKQSVANFGCNTQDIFFISIDQGDTDAEVQQFEATYLGGNSGYPVVSGNEGGGNAVNNSYSPSAYPTYILIGPNKQILENDMWPINDPSSFTNYFGTHNLSPKSCLSTGITEMANNKAKLNIYPNPAVNTLTIDGGVSNQLNKIKVYDVLGNVLVNELIDGERKHDIDISPFTKGVYFAEIVSANGTIVKKFNKQ